MDVVSMGEIRDIARILSLGVTQERRQELLQALEFILYQEERRDYPEEDLVPYSLKEVIKLTYSGQKSHQLTVQQPMRIRGFYINGELVSLCRPYEREGLGLSDCSVGLIRVNHPLELRDMFVAPGISISFTVWCNDGFFRDSTSIEVSVLGVTLKGSIEEKKKERFYKLPNKAR